MSTMYIKADELCELLGKNIKSDSGRRSYVDYLMRRCDMPNPVAEIPAAGGKGGRPSRVWLRQNIMAWRAEDEQKHRARNQWEYEKRAAIDNQLAHSFICGQFATALEIVGKMRRLEKARRGGRVIKTERTEGVWG